MIEKDVSVAHADGSESAMTFNEVLSSEAEIDNLIGRPNSRVLAKVTNWLDHLLPGIYWRIAVFGCFVVGFARSDGLLAKGRSGWIRSSARRLDARHS